jgi:fibronectin-binding autotransporter adhesin
MKPRFSRSILPAVCVVCVFLSSAYFASAASGTWNVDGSTTWATAGSWAGAIAGDSSSTANFTNNITADRTVTLSADTTINKIIFSDSNTSTAGSWILAHNGTSTNNLILAGTTPTVTVNALGTGKTATISAIIEGTAGLKKDGSGTLILSGANTYTGGTNISAGTLQLNAGGSLSSGAVTGTGNFINTISYSPLNDWSAFAGTYTHNSTTASSVFNIAIATSQSAAYNIASTQGSAQGIIAAGNGDYTLKMGSLAGVANSMIRGGNSATGTATLEVGNLAANTNFQGIIQNGTTKIIAFTKVGAGTQILSGVNLYTGTTTISTGTLQIGSGAAAGSISNSSAIINNASLVFSSTAAQSSAHAISGTGSLTKAEAGTLTISGANNLYQGGTIIGVSQGAAVLRAAATQALGSGTVTLDAAGNASTARLELTGGISLNNAIAFSGRTNTSVGIQNIAGNNTLSGTMIIGLGGSGYRIQSDAGKLTLSSPTAITALTSNRIVTFQGPGDTEVNGIIENGTATSVGITKADAGNLTLNGANTYTGTTTAAAGTLALGLNGTISNTLVMGSSTPSVGTLDVTAKSSFTQANVSGNGTLNIGAGKVISVTGALSPGFSPGTINVTGDLTLTGSTTTTMELAGNGGVEGIDSDDINVSGTITLDGILSIVGFGGYDPTQNSTYNLFDAPTFAGDFDSVSVGGNALSFATDVWSGTFGLTSYSFSETTGVLTVVPEPAAALLGGIGMLALLRRRRV